MAHFALIDDDDTVQSVIVIGNDICGEPTLSFPDTCAAGRAFIANTLKLPGTWKQTSYNGAFRGCYAGIGYTYDEANDVFVPPASVPDHDI
jgi:hypothetical protein